MAMLLTLALCFLGARVEAFGVATAQLPQTRAASSVRRARSVSAVVIDISSTDEFNEALETAGDSLVVVDYSTSWCGPCKIIAPKFDEFSEQYKNVAFLKVCSNLAACALPCCARHLFCRAAQLRVPTASRLTRAATR